MSDQCRHCQLKGDIKKCLAADCFQHENWYAKEQQKRIDNLQAQVNALEEMMMECTTHGELDESLFNSYMEHATNHKKCRKGVIEMRLFNLYFKDYTKPEINLALVPSEVFRMYPHEAGRFFRMRIFIA